MSKNVKMWVRCMVAFALVLMMTAGGFFAQGMSYALDDDAPDVIEEVDEEDIAITEESIVDLEAEIAILQEANPEAVAVVTSDGSQTTYDDFNAALADWSDKNSTEWWNRDATLTLLKDVKATVSEPIRFTKRSGKKTLNLNGHTATLTMADDYANNPLIYVGKYNDSTTSDPISIELVIDDYSRAAQNDSAQAGALICNNALNVINVSGHTEPKTGSVNDPERPSRLELHRGTVSGGTQNTIVVDAASDAYDATFVMTGGTVSGCAGPVVGSGAQEYTGYGVRLCGKALFEMWGGTICDNTGGGGVWLYEPLSESFVPLRFNMYGGTICNNGLEGVRIAKGGGYAYADVVFTMTGGEITGNGTGVLVSNYFNSEFNLEGSPRILANGSNGVARNVVLERDKRITITGALATPEGTNGPQIGIRLNKNGSAVPFTFNYNDFNPNADPATFFKSDVATALDDVNKEYNAYVCWANGENEEGTGPNSTDPEDNAEAARMLHRHNWRPSYQYAFGFENGEAVVSHQENLLTAVCENACHHPYAFKHRACVHALSATLTISAQSKAYDGTPATATLTPSEDWIAENRYQYDESKIAYFKRDSDALTPLSGAPTDVGDYVAQYKLDVDDHWEPGDTTPYTFITTSFSITPVINDVTYNAHCQTYGWNAPSGSNGTTAGTVGEAKRLEALTIKLASEAAGSIEYRSHVQGDGWEKSWAKNGDQSGTVGQGKRIEALQVRITGARAKSNNVWYRVQSQTFGWLGWACNGEPAGTAGMGKRAEAYQVVVLPDGQVPKDYDASVPAFRSGVTGNAHVQDRGWMGNKFAGTIGTTGKSKRLEGVKLTLPASLTSVYGGSIVYEAHVQSKGWMGEVADGALAGTTGEGKRMEAVKIHLAGDISAHFSVWYRVHSQTFGWSGWTKDGKPAGSTSFSKRVEAVEVVVLPKGAAAPGRTANAFRSK